MESAELHFRRKVRWHPLEIVFWLMGSLADRSLQHVWLVLPPPEPRVAQPRARSGVTASAP